MKANRSVTKLNHGVLLKWIGSMGLKPKHVLFLMVVAGHWQRGKVAFPSVKRISLDMGYKTERPAEKILRELRELDIPYLRIESSNSRVSNRYHFDEQAIVEWYNNGSERTSIPSKQTVMSMESIPSKQTVMGGGKVIPIPSKQTSNTVQIDGLRTIRNKDLYDMETEQDQSEERVGDNVIPLHAEHRKKGKATLMDFKNAEPDPAMLAELDAELLELADSEVANMIPF